MITRRRAAVIIISVTVPSHVPRITDTREVVYPIDATTLE